VKYECQQYGKGSQTRNLKDMPNHSGRSTVQAAQLVNVRAVPSTQTESLKGTVTSTVHKSNPRQIGRLLQRLGSTNYEGV
jgi:hypothetical protein